MTQSQDTELFSPETIVELQQAAYELGISTRMLIRMIVGTWLDNKQFIEDNLTNIGQEAEAGGHV